MRQNLRFAHTPSEQKPDQWHILEDHIQGVADLAKQYGSKFGLERECSVVGYYHDLGKYDPVWQEYLINAHNGIKSKSPGHSEYGSVFLFNQAKNLDRTKKAGLMLCGMIVHGHHGQIPNGADWVSQCHTSSLQPIDFVNKNIQVSDTLTTLQARMVFSSLIDADRTDTELFYHPNRKNLREPKTYNSVFINKYNLYTSKFSNRQDLISKIRTTTNQSCVNKSDLPQGFFTLTAPTGVGKTLASLNFAINHAKTHNLDRIICTLPFTSIIDQMAQEYSEIFEDSNVLEHHMNVEFKSSTKEWLNKINSENWNSPFVLTTNVQFFDTLYSNRTSKLRKLHNVSRSVIIIDEPQMIPPDKIKVYAEKLKELVDSFGCTIVFCTATPLDYVLLGIDSVELLDDHNQVFEDMKRVEYHLMFDAEPIGPHNLLADFKERHQALLIVNTKPSAKYFYEMFKQSIGEDGLFHLSTNMVTKHRLLVINEIKRRLSAGEKCLVISTQLIECGVDLDFPVVYRQLAPLPSIIQSAGRCNRNGKLTKGQVYIFRLEPSPDYRLYPDASYESLTNITLNSFLKNNLNNCDMPEVSSKYFRQLLTAANTTLDIQSLENSWNFPALADFALIDDESESVLTEYDLDALQDIKADIEKNAGQITSSTRKKIQRNSVNMNPWTLKKNIIKCKEFIPDSGINLWIGGYDENTGIVI